AGPVLQCQVEDARRPCHQHKNWRLPGVLVASGAAEVGVAPARNQEGPDQPPEKDGNDRRFERAQCEQNEQDREQIQIEQRDRKRERAGAPGLDLAEETPDAPIPMLDASVVDGLAADVREMEEELIERLEDG